jgi:ParB-like chromosome segregation protein Spo0J
MLLDWPAGDWPAGDWPAGEVRPLPVSVLGEYYRRYRLPDAEAEAAMARSLERYGQIAPIVVWLREETPEVIDGFKRLTAARALPRLGTLSARRLCGDERSAKAAIYGLNREGRPTRELEEAWIVQALVREDGLTQVEAAELLGRHKSWVCRRLALLEKLAVEAREDLRLGLLSVTAARSLVRLPADNQAQVLVTARREGLTSVELRAVVELLEQASSREQEEYILARPREALEQAQGQERRAWDPRLSAAGNRIGRHVGMLLELLARIENWLEQRGRANLTVHDRSLLAPRFVRLAQATATVSELANDWAGAAERPRMERP